MRRHNEGEHYEVKAQEILDQMDRRHDASIGISWDTIDCYLTESFRVGRLIKTRPYFPPS